VPRGIPGEARVRAPGVTAGLRRALRPVPHGRVLGYPGPRGHAIVLHAPGIALPTEIALATGIPAVPGILERPLVLEATWVLRSEGIPGPA
jgi:hypothetical protein